MLKIAYANCTVEELYNVFSRFGRIVLNCKRGYAIIRFEDEEIAKRAMKQYDGHAINKKRLKIRLYHGGPVQQDHEQIDIEPNPGEKHADRLTQTVVDRIHEEALNKIKEFRPKFQDIIKQAAEGIEIALKGSLEEMIASNFPEEKQKTLVDQYCLQFEKETTRLHDRLQPGMKKMVQRLSTFDRKPINLEETIDTSRLEHLVTEEPLAMDVRKPFYDTQNCGPVKRMLAVSDCNFLAAFSGTHCCKLYRVDDFKPLKSETTNPNPPTAMATFEKQDRHYCIFGDCQGHLRILNLDSFERQYDEQKMHNGMIMDIKRVRQNRFLSCSREGIIRMWKADEEQRTHGDYSLEISKKQDEIHGEGTIASMDILNEEEIVLGVDEMKIIVMNLTRARAPSPFIQQSPALKVVHENDRQFWGCMDTTIKLLDSRCIASELIFEAFGSRIRALTKVSSNIFAYGGDRMVGLGDMRNNKMPLWKNTECHSQDVRDMLCLGRSVFSSGMDGRIIKWSAL